MRASIALVLLAVSTALHAQEFVPPLVPGVLPPGLEFLALPTVTPVPPTNHWAQPGGISCGETMMAAYLIKVKDYEGRIKAASNYIEAQRLLKEEGEYISQFREKLKTPVYGWAPYHFRMTPEDPLCSI